MAEVLVKFSEAVRGGDGRLYWAQACGAVASDGMWEAWIEFENDGEAIRSGRETEQPKRDDIVYWAQGLTMTYLQGALDRAQRLAEGPVARPIATRNYVGRPRFERPATDVAVTRPVAVESRAILDPFAVYREGEQILRKQLRALSTDQLANIISAYQLGLSTAGEAARDALADEIVRAVASRARLRAPRDSGKDARGHA